MVPISTPKDKSLAPTKVVISHKSFLEVVLRLLNTNSLLVIKAKATLRIHAKRLLGSHAQCNTSAINQKTTMLMIVVQTPKNK